VKSSENPKTEVRPLFLAGQILSAWRSEVHISQRALARRLGVTQPTWRNVEIGAKPPGRVLFIRMILFLKLTKKQILSLSKLYHYHNIELMAGEKEILEIQKAFSVKYKGSYVSLEG
jgi:transcriptional regulator with XRE-family HTH domain